MTDWGITPPPARMQWSVLPEFDSEAATARMNRVTFLRSIHTRAAGGDPHAQAVIATPGIRDEVAAYNSRVATYSGMKAPAPAPPSLRAAPAPSAAVPRSPRAVTPTTPQPATPVLSGLQGRVDMLTRLVSPPPLPPGLID
jgi:hypothetical protein